MPDASEVPGVVAYWRFDEGDGDAARDAKSEAVGKLHGAKWVDGIRGKALEFDGKGWFDFGATAKLDVAKNAEETICCWVKPQSANGPVFVFRGKESNVGASAALGVWLSGGKLRAVTRPAGGSGGQPDHPSAGEVVLNEWHHVALARHADGTVELFLDGASVSRKKSILVRGAVTTTSRALGLDRGARAQPGRPAEPSRDFHGAIDEFAVFDRVLSAADIAKLAGR